MKIPEKPPTDAETNKLILEIGKDNHDLINKLKPYLNIVNTDYLHWDELQVDNRFSGVNLKLLWGFSRLSREFNVRQIRLNGFTLRYVQTPQIEKLLHDLDMRVGGEIDLESKMPSPVLQKKYLVNSLMEEAIASSQLEGAATTRVVAKKMLLENRNPRNRSEQMILNNYVTMRYIKENTERNQELTSELIKEIHKKITKDTFEDKQHEGAFRLDNEVKVFSRDTGQIVYEPPDYQKIGELIAQVCNFANNETEGYYLHPIVKAIILHYTIGYIHPFNDGNGRTARALFYWYLITQGYSYLEYIAVSTSIKNAPAQYARAYLYCETDSNDITYFVKFNLRALDIAVTAFEKYVNKTKAENRKIFDTIQANPELNFRQVDVLIELGKNERPITISEMQERYHITYQTARTDLLDLEKSGYLRMFEKGKRFFFILEKDKLIGDKINISRQD